MVGLAARVLRRTPLLHTAMAAGAAGRRGSLACSRGWGGLTQVLQQAQCWLCWLVPAACVGGRGGGGGGVGGQLLMEVWWSSTSRASLHGCQTGHGRGDEVLQQAWWRLCWLAPAGGANRGWVEGALDDEEVASGSWWVVAAGVVLASAWELASGG